MQYTSQYLGQKVSIFFSAKTKQVNFRLKK